MLSNIKVDVITDYNYSNYKYSNKIFYTINDNKKLIFSYYVIGSSYNIPIVVWLQKTHPQDSPIVYVTPTPGMRINPSRYVDGSGRVYLPYLTEWTLVYTYTYTHILGHYCIFSLLLLTS